MGDGFGIAGEVHKFLLDLPWDERRGRGVVPVVQNCDGVLEIIRVERVQFEEGGQVSVTIVSPCGVV